MKRSALLLLAFLMLHTSAFAVVVQSRIDAVAVYPSGAVVTRVARVDLPAGTSMVRLTGLVNDLDPDQVQLQAVAANVELGQIRIDREQQRDAFNAEIDSLNADIAALQERIAGIDDAIKSAELRLKFLDGLAAGYSKEAWLGSAQGAADINSWRQALALLESASSDAYTSIREQKAARAAAERDLSLLQRNLVSKRGGALSSTVLEVTVRAATATTTELRLDYFQGDAAWRSQYEARLDSNTGTLRLTQQAVIEQGTDESWSNVALSLSTSDPSGDLEPGGLDPEFLDF
ncbi:MAG: mucoidy inhibitor MuiA family protein, partial [Woeseia sp.]